MNLNVVRLGPLTREVAGLRKAVERLAEAFELQLSYEGLHVTPPKADTSGAEPETLYSDEERDAVIEMLERTGRMTDEMRDRLYGAGEDVQPEDR